VRSANFDLASGAGTEGGGRAAAKEKKKVQIHSIVLMMVLRICL
jgi:hypothetical protein